MTEKKRFCNYGQHFMPDVGFIFKLHAPSGTRRGMCPICQANRRKPREEHERMAKQEREDRLASQRARNQQKVPT